MNWISVKDKLPENSDYVLVKILGYNEFVVGFYDEGWIVSEYGKNTPGEEFFDSELINHWMPIPKPPKD
jgi:hypothetical protein